MNSPIMNLPFFFLVVAAVLAAPHLTWPQARCFALVCIVCAVAFWLVLMWIGQR